MVKSSVDLERIIEDLWEDYQRLTKIVKNTDPEDKSFPKLYDAKTKIGALLRDFLKLHGIESLEDDLVTLLEKLPENVVKKVEEVLKRG